MRLYSDYPGASISMAASPKLRQLLENTFRQEKITHVIETGTYQGLGSTTLIAESFPENSPPQIFLSIEINWDSWCHAKRNLRRFPFVTPVWGRTVPVQQALEFIETDGTLRDHHEYPDIFIDDTRDPIQFYRNELLGHLGETRPEPINRLCKIRDRMLYYGGDNLLEKYLGKFCSNNPLIALDSAGAIGFLEFSVVEQVMRPYSYLLLLDDIHHLKHFRSLRHVERDRGFQILEVDKNEGWLLAKHMP